MAPESGAPGACKEKGVVHTVGHSTRAIEWFVSLLREHSIERLVDVRRWPSSRKFPHFNKEPLADSLRKVGIEYSWLETLGGYRKPEPDSPNSGWRVGAFRGYADFMTTAEFRSVLAMVEATARQQRIALMCAEAVWWRCHRQLISDALLVRGWTVRHILDSGCEPHRLTPFARVRGDVIVYAKEEPSSSPALFEPRQ